ncbi:hypothetical protein [Deinococcus soli (ex Cha et al. 2016)]|uniref:hypothetical protein n=1 Tax=Deinococcus soli (ex Cha et al. 2016) TaxID=1309411 RepID=UPI001666953B|nr:hypothetical protein [Deinococcus soli (ex Cha et al. 2016)]GGB80411.1 hypothetical protein GCM10008019_40810 [Deinococcus soli (ex Cha et al. 2016)]
MIVLFGVLIVDALLLVVLSPMAHTPLIRAGLLAGAVVTGCLALAVLLEVLREWK